jgi:glyoxylase-like metal-dependent hydrolase (beta-lactamase superfamily II)
MKTLYIDGSRGNSHSSNTYIYYDGQTLEGVVIDPGMETERVIKAIEENSITLQSILLTHGHFDHFAAIPELTQRYNAPICAMEEENAVLQDPRRNVSSLFGSPITINADKLLHDGDEITVGNGILKVIHTPGHTVGGACFYAEKSGILFSGDTLFRESIGRTDFYTGDSKSIIASIREKLYTLPDDVRVFSGHGEQTTIGHEKRYNPFTG